MTNQDDDPRIRYIHEHLEPEKFVASARGICRAERIVINGVDRGNVPSSLVPVGDVTNFHHIMGDPRGNKYEVFSPFCR